MSTQHVTQVAEVRLNCDKRGCLSWAGAQRTSIDDTIESMTHQAELQAELSGWTGWENTATGRPYTRDYCLSHTPKKPPANLRRTY